MSERSPPRAGVLVLSRIIAIIMSAAPKLIVVMAQAAMSIVVIVVLIIQVRAPANKVIKDSRTLRRHNRAASCEPVGLGRRHQQVRRAEALLAQPAIVIRAWAHWNHRRVGWRRWEDWWSWSARRLRRW